MSDTDPETATTRGFCAGTNPALASTFWDAAFSRAVAARSVRLMKADVHGS